MNARSIIIIGAGVAGLSAGCYAQMNGYQAEIFEKHTQPGGLCTAWQRKGYTFDGCIHHLAGAGPQSRLHRLWKELGIFNRHTMIFHDDLVRVELPDGQSVSLYTDLERLEAHLKALAPEDAPVIDRYLRAARRFLDFDLLAVPFDSGPAETAKLITMLPTLIKWGGITLEQFAQQFKSPLLRQVIPTLQYDFPGVPVMVHLNFLAGCATHTLGSPSGGSLAFARSLAEQFETLGGQIHYKSPIAKILVQNDRAVGVCLADGTEHHADVILSAADGYTTLFEMLDGRYVDDRIRAYYAAAPGGNEMNFCVALGVARDMSAEPHALTCFLAQPAELLDSPHDRMDVEIFNFDPALAPAGKTSLKVLLKTSYTYWKALSADRVRYDEEKQRVAETVIAQLDKRFPGLASQVEVIDVSTPLTIERYTGNYHGLQVWAAPGAGILDMLKGGTRTLPGLAGFHMAGQWAEAMIGISTAAISGRNAIRRICKEEGRKFRVE